MRIRPHLPAAILGAVLLPLTSCSADNAAEPSANNSAPSSAPSSAQSPARSSDQSSVQSSPSDAAVVPVDQAVDDGAGATPVAASGSLFDTSVVHSVAIDVDANAVSEAVAAYLDDGDKEWVEADVTIDGVTYTQVGLRLKGNSSLRGIGTDTPAEELPWKVSLDKFVDGQNADGVTEFAIRSNTSATALNEAVALDMLDAAGLPAEAATYVALSVNGSPQTLRLVVDLPNDEWMAATFDDAGALYKAESTGDYSYRGTDPEAYDDVFDQEAGDDTADLTPLIDFLDFINNADDDTFAAELGDRLDVESFARYLAMMDLVDNFDDIDGPGNNSYLYYDATEDRFSVVAWDLNLAFGLRPGGGPGGNGAPGDPPGGAAAAGQAPPARPNNGDAAPGALDPAAGGPAGPGAGGPGEGGPGGARSNVLAERFRANADFAALYEQAFADLTAQLVDDGVLEILLAARAAVVDSSNLIDADTVQADAAAIRASAAAADERPTAPGSADPQPAAPVLPGQQPSAQTPTPDASTTS